MNNRVLHNTLQVMIIFLNNYSTTITTRIKDFDSNKLFFVLYLYAQHQVWYQIRE